MGLSDEKSRPNQPLEYNAYVRHDPCGARLSPAIVMAHL